MSTFEGPMMSLRSVNALSHYTDWTIAHVHGGALGWNGFISFGMIYYLIPKLWKVEVWSKRLMNIHFWSATIGIVLYITAMWTAGVTQGLMWRALNSDGTLKYPDFLETVTKLIPFYWARLLGGTLYIAGLLIMVYNVWRSIQASRAAKASLEDASVAVAADYFDHGDASGRRGWHHALEGKTFLFSVLSLSAILIGSIIEIVPMVAVRTNIPTIPSVKPYTPLELEGRDIYIREGCYNCHSQMIRTLPEEVLRYGAESKSGEFVYDRPFQFGSKRTGPDLQRVGGKYPSFWHFRHMLDPRSTSQGSIMPAYPWLYDDVLNTDYTRKKMEVLTKLGVPYTQDEMNRGVDTLREQAHAIAAELGAQGVPNSATVENKEIIAMIAYLQRLGVDGRK
jgi:cytochrome c oxidase cbb3-type subunit I/II